MIGNGCHASGTKPHVSLVCQTGPTGYLRRMEVMIEVNHLTKYFGPILAVDDISFRVASGEIVGFLGPNGAGKTTTIRILAGIFPPTSGEVRVAGHDVMREPL